MTAIQKQIADQINSNNVVVYSKSYCPYCTRAKSELAKIIPSDMSVLILELDNMDDGSNIQNHLLELTGQRSVPNIFINKKHVGGCDDLLAKIKNGQIKSLLSN
ncbi:Glutaredoxin [Smittium culicis]|uniref:Glutaredoxin n=1 Tax=Smittium culicis TaxID=133412 RepID=A0A1R1XAP4_9FUNG|nr:Glutaredoxin [Smittium culicis]OMJ11694.1 Glutaredoxin [Smittium culicis]